MLKVTVEELEKGFDEYISMIESGKENKIDITKDGVSFASIVPYHKNSIVGIGVGKMECKNYNLDAPEFDDIAKDFGY